MIMDYYNLREQPFGVTPDSRYLFLSATHREALGSLVYGLASGCGFVALIAKPGMGKTTLLFDVLSRIKNKSKVVFLFQTVSTPIDCMKAILADLGVQDTSGSLFDLQSRLNEVLTEESRSGKHLVIVFDEAQSLDDSVLEFVRMLSNFETPQQKLIQVILTGQPELADKLASPELVQLRQRISILACLRPLSVEETTLYVDHRLQVAGYLQKEALFTPEALAMIARASHGIPRNINNLCFNALSLGCAMKRKQIDGEIIIEVIKDLDLAPLGRTEAEMFHMDEETKPIGQDVVHEASRGVEPHSLVIKPDGNTEERKRLDKDIGRDTTLDFLLPPLVQTTPELHKQRVEGGQTDRAVAPNADATFSPEPFVETQFKPSSDEELARQIPLFASIVGTPSTLWSRLTKVAVASAVLLGMGVYQVQVRVVSIPGVSAETKPVAPPITLAPQEQLNDNPTPQLIPAVSTVQVTPGKTLYRICTTAFGRCNPALMQDIRKLNPRLGNPNHIESGEKIRLPVTSATLGGTEVILEPAGMHMPENKDVQ